MTYERVCSVGDVAQGAVKPVSVGGVDVAVVHTSEGWYAIADECSHAAIPLSDGDLEGCLLECYMHGSRFDVRTGQPDQLPATAPVATYSVQVDGDDVLVDVDTPKNTSELEMS